MESAYLRAICRTIGLNALQQIIMTPGSHIRQDVVGWLISSLRGKDNKLYHFTDDLQGCGYFLEGVVNIAFKKMLESVVNAMSMSDNADEIKCMLEALKWKFHGDDHAFLAEIDLFGIIRGRNDLSLLRQAWGKGLSDSIKEYLSALPSNTLFSNPSGAIKVIYFILILILLKIKHYLKIKTKNLKLNIKN